MDAYSPLLHIHAHVGGRGGGGPPDGGDAQAAPTRLGTEQATESTYN